MIKNFWSPHEILCLAYPIGLSSTLLCSLPLTLVCLTQVATTVALTPTHANQGYSPLNLPSPYMPMNPAFCSRGFSIPPPVFPLRAQSCKHIPPFHVISGWGDQVHFQRFFYFHFHYKKLRPLPALFPPIPSGFNSYASSSLTQVFSLLADCQGEAPIWGTGFCSASRSLP